MQAAHFVSDSNCVTQLLASCGDSKIPSSHIGKSLLATVENSSCFSEQIFLLEARQQAEADSNNADEHNARDSRAVQRDARLASVRKCIGRFEHSLVELTFCINVCLSTKKNNIKKKYYIELIKT